MAKTIGGCVADVMLRNPKVHSATASVGEVRLLFADDHIHMALLVDGTGLVATVVRSDLDARAGADEPAREAGTLEGRTMPPAARAAETLELMRRDDLRRLAVVDESGTLLGLLCRTERGDGFCTDEGVESRRLERER